MSDMTPAQLADEMYKIVRELHGKKEIKPMDMGKELTAHLGVEFKRKEVKDGLKALMASGRCIYSYAGKSAVVLNPDHADNEGLVKGVR